MTLNDHYKFHSRKSLKPYISLLFLIVLCIGLFQTLARYSNASGINGGVQIAKWNIKINNQAVTNQTS